MKLPEIFGTLTGFTLLGADALKADQPVLPLPDTHSTGDPWADVAMFSLRIVAYLGIALGPTLLGKWVEQRSTRKINRRRRVDNSKGPPP